MKLLRVLSIFAVSTLVIVLVTFGQNVDARLQAKTPLDLYVENELILVGKVISLNENSTANQTEYKIKVEKYLKSPKEFDIINATGHGAKSSEIHTSVEKIFDKGARVLLFLNQMDGIYNISPYSVNAETFDPDSDFILPPLRLFKAGISPEDIVCRGDLTLVFKAKNNFPACVEPDSISKLTTLGWIRL